MSSDDSIIQLDVGYKRVKQEGIDPFVRFIETSEREFFKAKEFVTLYDLIFKMCIQRDPYNWSEAMYEKYTQSILDYLLTLVQPALNTAKQAGYEGGFLKEWKQRWANHKLIVQGLSKLFMYLDRFYTPNSDGILSLKEQGFKQYKEHVFDSFHLHARLCILNAIEKERNNEQQDRYLLQEAVNVYVEIGFQYASKKLEVYKQDLEKAVIAHAGVYYQRKSREWMDQDSAPVYMEKVEKMLASERNRVEAYLNRSTLDPLHKELYVQMLKTHQKELLRKKTGIFHLLSIHAVDDLSRMYRLYKGNDADLEVIAEMLGEHIKKAGTEVVDRQTATRSQVGGEEKVGDDDEKEGKESKMDDGEEKSKAAADKPTAAAADSSADANHALVRNLIALHAQYNEIVTLCFEKAQVMQKALKKAFEEFINKDNRVSKLLAKFVNDVLKRGSKLNVKDVESTLDNVVFLYGYIQEKDVFERDYQCLGEGTRVLMFSGHSKAVEEVRVGDLLMGDDGTPRTVQVVRRGDTRKDAQQHTPPAYTYRAGYLDSAGNLITDWYRNQRPKDESGRYVCCWEECSSTFSDMSALRRHFAEFKHRERGAEPAMYRVTGNRGDTASWTCTGKHKLVLRWNSRGWVVSYTAVPATPWALVQYAQSGANGSVHTVVSQTFALQSDAQAARDAAQSLLEAVVSVDAYNASATVAQRDAVMMTARQPLGFQLPARRLRDLLAAVLGVASDTISQQLLLDTAWLLGVYCMRGDGATVVLGDSGHGAAGGVTALIQAWVARAPQVTAARALPVSRTPQSLLEEHWCGSAADRKAAVQDCGPAMQALAAEYGLCGERHVPWELLTEEIPLRRALLAGVMDADGSYSADINEYRITVRQYEKELQATLVHLLRGLGCVVRSCSKEARGWSAMVIAVDDNLASMQPVTAAKRVRRKENAVDPHCYGFDVQRAEHGVYYAIQIDGNHKHLLEDCTVVHNCFLSHRLLMGLCESEHSEKSMIAKLKTECGYQWTNKLEGMFKDVQLSKDMMQQFRKLNDQAPTAAKKEADEVQLEVNVCTTGYWPSSKVIPCKMPRDLSAACDKYKRFYLNQHSGHKLEWRFDQGQGEIVVDFSPTCRKGLVLSTYQMMILLVFNTVKRVTYKEVLDMTGIPRFEIANHLLSLCHPKVNVVLKRPNNKKLDDSHQFMLNAQYKNALKKVNVPLLRAVEAEDTGEEENKAIELQRRHQMDAAIVRIMKTRKSLRHNLLVAEVIQQLTARFKPKPNDIKKRIEALIEQEYMERDKDDRGVYSYLA